METSTVIFASGTESTDRRRNSVVLENWQIDDLRETKKLFWKAGFCTYEDIELVCLCLLSSKESLTDALARRFPVIFVDECQDLSWVQLQIFDALKKKGAVLRFVGDLNQSIYEFKKVDPKKVKDFVDGNGFSLLELRNNFRSCQPIVDVCSKLVDEDTPVAGQFSQQLDSPCICVPYKRAEPGTLVSWFEAYLRRAGIPIEKSAIVTRSWRNVSLLRPSGNQGVDSYQRRLAMAICLYQTGCSQALDDSVKYLGRFFAEKFFPHHSCNSTGYFCPECVSSSLQWRQFLAYTLDECSKNSCVGNLSETWSDWAKNVRKYFGAIARNNQAILESHWTIETPTIADLDGNDFRVPSGQGNRQVVDTLVSKGVQNSQIQITTIHSVKGKTLEAVLVVSAPTKQGTTDGHWTQWIDNRGSEASRLAYVASSRPRHLLAWAVPEPDNTAKQRIKDLGFVIMGET